MRSRENLNRGCMTDTHRLYVCVCVSSGECISLNISPENVLLLVPFLFHRAPLLKRCQCFLVLFFVFVFLHILSICPCSGLCLFFVCVFASNAPSVSGLKCARGEAAC